MKTSPKSTGTCLLLLLTSSIGFGGCAMVYSPFLHLPSAPPDAGSVEVSTAASVMPETSFGWAVGGGEGIVRWAATNNFTLQARAWSRTGNIPSLSLDGTSLDAIISFGQIHTPHEQIPFQDGDKFSQFDWALVPRVMSLFGGNELGLAGSLSAAVWLPKIWIFRPYVATGGIVGGGVDSGPSGGTAFGYGMINNLGVTTIFDRHWSVNGELANTIQRVDNPHEAGHITWIYVLPSITVNYRF